MIPASIRLDIVTPERPIVSEQVDEIQLPGVDGAFGVLPGHAPLLAQLQPGELSGIIQLGDRFVILKCEGLTQPVELKYEEVRDVLYQDIFEKKLRMAMAKKFDELRAKSRIDNFLAGTTQAPDRVKVEASQPASQIDPAIRQTSGGQVTPR